MLTADPDQEPIRGSRRGTIYRMRWPDGSRAKTTLACDIDEAITLKDPFQPRKF